MEDSLAATRIYSQQILRQQEAVKDAQDYLDLELVRYNTGVDPYVDVVIAQTTLLDNQETLNALQVEEMTSAVRTGAGAGRRMGSHAAAHAGTGGRQDDQGGLHAAAVARGEPIHVAGLLRRR